MNTNKTKAVKAWGLLKYFRNTKEYIILPIAVRSKKELFGKTTDDVGAYKLIPVLITEIPSKRIRK